MRKKRWRDGPASEAGAIEPAQPPATSGLNDLDRERASSVADEGGVSAATIESQEAAQAPRPHRAGGSPQMG
jgi:hypothetical protein